MYMVYAQSGPARLGMRSAETFEEAREKADQTARELSDRLSAPYEEVRKQSNIMRHRSSEQAVQYCDQKNAVLF